MQGRTKEDVSEDILQHDLIEKNLEQKCTQIIHMSEVSEAMCGYTKLFYPIFFLKLI